MSPGDAGAPGRVPYGAAVYLGVVQFFFACTWIVYVIYLPSIAETAGIAKRAVIWILMIDQIVFAVMDLAMGLWADRVAGALRRLGPAILAISCVSCVAFLLLPHAAVLGTDGSRAAPAVVLLLILVWTATSSALRAPLWVLLSKYAATPSMPFLSALCLTGVAVSGAISPYLGVKLRGIDPVIPFAVSALTLLATTAGLIWVERRVALGGRSADVAAAPARAAVGPGVIGFFVGCGVLSIGFQIHFFLNSSTQYLRFARPADLDYLMPVFWIGFNLLMFPGASLARRYGGVPVMAGAAALGMLGMLVAAQAEALATLIAGQFLAGGAWGAAMMAAFAGSMAFGHKGREGLMVGTLSSLFALAAFFRIATVAMDANKGPTAADVLPWLPLALWLIGGCALLSAALASRRGVTLPREG